MASGTSDGVKVFRRQELLGGKAEIINAGCWTTNQRLVRGWPKLPALRRGSARKIRRLCILDRKIACDKKPLHILHQENASMIALLLYFLIASVVTVAASAFIGLFLTN